MDIGPAESGGFGPVQITRATIRAWQDDTGVELAPWQTQLLRRLSREWVNESSRATRKNARAPGAEMTLEQRRQMVSDQVDAMFGAMAEKTPKPPAVRKPRRKRN